MIRRAKPLTHLVDANPCWYGHKDRERVGLLFECPIHEGCHIGVQFMNPPDGGKQMELGRPAWAHVGEDFDSMSLAPSIKGPGGDYCGWHGYVKSGKLITLPDST